MATDDADNDNDNEDDRESEPAPAPTAGTSRSRRTWPSSVALLSLVCVMQGAMLGGSALGVAHSTSASTTAQGSAAGPSTTSGIVASPVNSVGVGVLRAPVHEAESAPEPLPGQWLASTLANIDAQSREANEPRGRANGQANRRRSNGGGGVSSDNVAAGPAQGYVNGRAVRIVVTRMDAKPVEVHTAMAFERMRTAAARDGITLRIVSGFRTMEHQQALYAAFRRGHGNLAARPGESNHQSGHALDLNTSTPGVLRWLQRHGARFGFRRTVPSEPWHWEWW